MTSLWLVLAACSGDPSVVHFDNNPRVEVVEVAPPPAQRERVIVSTLEPVLDAMLGPARPGTVVKVLATTGQAVGKGDALVQLDDRDARAALAAARAGLAEAQAVLEEAKRAQTRVGALGEGVSGAQQDAVATGVLRAEAGRDAAAAQASMAELEVEHRVLRAPFAGVVAWLDVVPGASVAPGMPVARVVDLTAGRVVIGLVDDEVEAASSPNASFQVRAGAITVPATLVHVSSAADPRTRDWKAEVRVEGMPAPAGRSVEVVIALPVTAADGLLPPTAVRGGTAWTVTNGVVHATTPQVVDEVAEGLLVTGLAPGTQVVVHASDPLTEGDTVVVLPSPPRGAGVLPGGEPP